MSCFIYDPVGGIARIKVRSTHGTHPLYTYLKKAQPGLFVSEAIEWNITMFLVNREGQVLKRYAPTDTLEKIGNDLKEIIELSNADI